MIVAGVNRGGIESQAIKAAFRSLAESVRSPPNAPAAAGGTCGEPEREAWRGKRGPNLF